MNGWSIALFSGCITLVAVIMLSPVGILVGVLVTAAGAMEVYGNRLMKSGLRESIRWLCGAQIYLLAILVLYCGVSIFLFRPESALENLPPEILTTILSLGFDEASLRALIAQVFYLTYFSVIIVSALYQGGLCLYYWSKRNHFAATIPSEPQQPAIG